MRVVDNGGRPAAAPGLARWLARVAPASARGTVAVVLVPDSRVRALNRAYRKKDYATDVLSFPADPVHSSHQAHLSHPSHPGTPFLGDIVIATGVARCQARDAGHAQGVELKILALHGLLHLLGYDHERDGGRMARAERRLRRKGGLERGLIERAGVKARPARP